MLHDWFMRLNKTMEMEELIHISQDTYDKYYKNWACWIHYGDSSAYNTTMSQKATWIIS